MTDPIYIVQFHSMAGQRGCEGAFITKEAADNVYEAARSTLSDFQAEGNDFPILAFSFEDDFGFKTTLNLVNFIIQIFQTDLSAQRTKAISEAQKTVEDDLNGPVGITS